MNNNEDMGTSENILSQFDDVDLTGYKPRTSPLWLGPERDDLSDDFSSRGITFSLLSRFLVCRERFRVHAIEGISSADSFNHRIEYGNLWHIAEEAYANSVKTTGRTDRWKTAVEAHTFKYAQELSTRYSMQQDQVQHWYEVLRLQFPIYVDFWERRVDRSEKVTPLFSEKVFNVHYTLPSKRVVILRGKWDMGFKLEKPDSPPCLLLRENKTKGRVDEFLLERQLTNDLQSMFYLVAFAEAQDASFWNRSNKQWRKLPLAGVEYNVVRRPLSTGSKGCIRRRQPRGKDLYGESLPDFYERLKGILDGSSSESPGVDYFFFRRRLHVSPEDIQEFKEQTFNPILEELCDWYAWIVFAKEKNINPFSFRDQEEFVGGVVHWKHPYGVWNVLNEGGIGEIDRHLQTGSMTGLRQVDNLFPELS